MKRRLKPLFVDDDFHTFFKKLAAEEKTSIADLSRRVENVELKPKKRKGWPF